MQRKEINEQSPLRILEQSSHGGLGRGNLGVVMARAGVGKTAFLVHIALDSLMRDRKVFHVSLDTAVDHVKSWYDAVFSDLARATGLTDIAATQDVIAKNRIIQTFAQHGQGGSEFSVPKLKSAIEVLQQYAKFSPDVVLIDSFDWGRAEAAEIEALKALATELNIELWMTALTHQSQVGTGAPDKVPPPCDRYLSAISVVVFLQPIEKQLSVRLLKDHGTVKVSDTHLILHPDTMRLVDGRAPQALAEELPLSAYALLSGGAIGAEAEFGACAERYGLKEENYSFEGHPVARTRGLHLLSEEELRDGDVSLAYVSATMHRPYHQNPTLRKVLQSIWHQVNSSNEVFIVGVIQRDDTVKGGTGWAAELARHQQKPLHVYDQERRSWFTWNHSSRTWQPSRPTISHTRFTGTGTRSLTDDGRAAIQALFATSFGAGRPGRSGPLAAQ
ncbi:MAG: hypothetical protein KA244_02130 [Deltaproteobacteria bacterium]|nr:hypothetical protein [Deltaproteobacteria bacterium]